MRALTLLLCLCIAHPAWAWWDCRWQNRVKLKFVQPLTANAENEIVLGEITGYSWDGTVDNSVRLIASDDTTLIPFYMEPRAPAGGQRMHLWLKPNVAVNEAYLYFNYMPSGTTVNNASINSAANLNIFTSQGIRYWTKKSFEDPSSLSSYWTSFDNASSPVGYGCTILNNFNSVSNTLAFGASSDIVYNTVFVLDVPSSFSGSWRIRVGPDFGRGGGLYVDGIALDEQWGSDMFWGNSYISVNQILENYDFTLSPGKHFFRVYGAEVCCDGAAQIQLSRPGSILWASISTSSFNLTAPQCGTTKTLVVDPVNIKITKTFRTLSDPINDVNNPRNIPGAKLRYTVMVEKESTALPDSNSLVIRDAIPAGTTFVATSPIPGVAAAVPLQAVPPASTTGKTAVGPVMWWPDTSGLSLAPGNVAYSATTISGPYSSSLPGTTLPTTGANAAVKALQISPQGGYGCSGASPRFFVEFDVLVN